MTEQEKTALIAEVNYNLQHCFLSSKTKQLMHIALDTLTAPQPEAVAYIMGEENIDDFNHGYEFFAVRDAKDEPGMPSIALYTAPPSTAVNLAEMVPSKREEKETDYQNLRDEKRGWNACRAAILRKIEETK